MLLKPLCITTSEPYPNRILPTDSGEEAYYFFGDLRIASGFKWAIIRLFCRLNRLALWGNANFKLRTLRVLYRLVHMGQRQEYEAFSIARQRPI